MAYQDKSGKDQGKKDVYKKLREALKKGDVKPVYLICGAESHLKNTAVRLICDAVLGNDPYREMNTAVMEAPTPDDVLTAATTLPFMAERRVVIVKDFPPFFQKEKNAGENAEEDSEDESGNKSEIKAFAESLKALPPETCLIFLIRGEVDKRKSAFRAVSKAAELVELDCADKSDTVRSLTGRAGIAGRRLDPADADWMIAVCGEGLDNLFSELDKLIAYTEGRSAITRDDIAAVCSPRSEFKVFEMTDALLKGNARLAFRQLRLMESTGEDQIRLIIILGEQCRRVLYCSELRRERYSIAEIARIMGLPAFVTEKNAAAGMSYQPEQLRQFCLWCRDREYELKSGQIPEEGALEELMLRILQVSLAGRKKA